MEYDINPILMRSKAINENLQNYFEFFTNELKKSKIQIYFFQYFYLKNPC
jgi:hypothetical protein